MKNKFTWHKWFAWKPVKIYNITKPNQKVWLRLVERKKVDHWLYKGWFYRLIGEKDED